MAKLSLIGYWRNARYPHLPDPSTMIDPDWDELERHITGLYFSKGTVARSFMGYSPCRLCGMNNGAVEYTDGTYVWPEGLVHYIDEHAVRLPAVLVEHALRRIDEIEAAEIDETWWPATIDRPVTAPNANCT